jgi:lipopolysaccharide heptosyltransferase I
MNATDAAQPRILIVKLSSLGDLFHALPAVHNLKVALNARIDWATQPEYADLVRCFSDVERVIVFPRRAFVRGFGAFLRDLRRVQYDRVVDLQGLIKSGLVSRLAHARERIGPSYRREGADVFYSSVAGKRNPRRHAVLQALDVIDHLGLQRVPEEFPAAFPSKPEAGHRPRVALLPTSRWPSKNWPVGHFIDVGRRLRAARNVSLFVVGGKDAAEAGRAIEAGVPGTVNLAGRTNLVEMGSLLNQMDVLVSNDSGPMHMAAAIGTPVVALFGPTDPSRTGPYGPGHRVLQAPLPCRPCHKRVCRLAEQVCLASLQPQEVLAAVEDVLARSASRSA